MQSDKILEIKIENRIIDVFDCSKNMFVYPFGLPQSSIIVEPMLFAFNKQTVFINCYSFKINTDSIRINNLSTIKHDNKLASLADAAIVTLENYIVKGFKIFFIEIAGFDNLSILQIYQYINTSKKLLGLTIILFVNNKAYRSLFIDNHPRILMFDDVNIPKEENQFRLEPKT